MAKFELIIKLDEELFSLVPDSRKELLLKRLSGEIEGVILKYKLDDASQPVTFLPNDKRIRDFFEGIEIRKIDD